MLEALRKVRFGETLTYGEIAARAGNPRAHRAAGTAVGTNPLPIVVPCHRVVRAGGELGNYGGGPEMKARLLEKMYQPPAELVELDRDSLERLREALTKVRGTQPAMPPIGTPAPATA